MLIHDASWYYRNLIKAKIYRHFLKDMDIQKLFDNLTEEVSCSICGDVYNQPKQLPCLHSFCLECLNDLAQKRAVNGNIKCPLCQRQVAVPESGTFETLPSSFYINSLLDVLAIKQCGSSHVSCGNCSTKSPQSSYCFQCSQFWCGGCLNAHNILKPNKDHRVVELKDFQTKDYEDVFKRPAICKKEHHQKVLEYYCTECEAAACQVCVTLEHGGHNIKHLQVVSSEEKAKIMAQVDQAKNKARERANQIHKIEQDFLGVQQHGEEMKRQVNSFADMMIGAIQQKQRELITEIEKTTKTSQDRLKIGKEKIAKEVENIELAVNQAENLVQRGASAEIVQSRKQVEERLGELAVDQEETNLPQYDKLLFADNSYLADSLTVHGIGRLGTSDTDPVLSTVEGKGLTQAITGLEAQFVVTTKNSNGDVCYSPVDRVAVNLKRRGGEDAVENVQVQDNKDGTYRVSYFAADPGVHDVHVTVNREDVGDGNPFPPVEVKLRAFKPVLSFGSEGTGPGKFNRPYGVAVSEQGEIAVTDSANHRVQVFSNEGKFLLSFGKEGNNRGEFRDPRGVTYDRDGNLLVIDGENTRIQQFSRTRQCIRTFDLNKELDGEPTILSGISSCSNGDFIVTDYNNNRVLVFSRKWRLLLTLKDDKLVSPVHCIYHDKRYTVSGDNAVTVFNDQGEFLYQFGKKGDGDGEFNLIAGLALDKSGQLVVCDTNNHRLQLFKPDGTFCRAFGVHGTDPGNFKGPVSVAVLKDGKFVVAEFVGECVQVIE